MLGARRPAAGPNPPSADASSSRGGAHLLRSRAVAAIGLGALVKVALSLTGPHTGGLGFIDTVASLLLAGGGLYYLLRGLGALRRRLLWRVRRKLIISYLFVGVIPAMLIIAFFLLGGYLLFVNVTSYMLQTYMGGLAARVQAAAEVTAIEAAALPPEARQETLRQRRDAVSAALGAASIALVPVPSGCGTPAAGAETLADGPRTAAVRAGAWTHLPPPDALPSWVGCDGYAGLVVVRGGAAADTSDQPAAVGLVVRGVAMPPQTPGWAAVVDVPIDAEARARLRAETSLVVTGTRLAGTDVTIQVGGSAGDRTSAGSTEGEELPGPDVGVVQPSVSFLEYRDWGTGRTGVVQASMAVSIPDIYARLSGGQGPTGELTLSQAFVLVLITVGVLFLFIQVLAIAMGLALARSITGSVHELFTGTIKVQHGDFSHRIAVRARDQLGALAESFNSMTASIEGLLLEAAEKKRLEEELRIAHEIQLSLLPRAPVTLPGLSIAALCVPAREVGGDYYDFLPLPDGRLGVLIADVAGKGTSAALYMAEMKGLMLSLSQTHRSPRDLLIVANRLIAEHLDARSFITMTYAIIDLPGRAMTYARAGHTPLLYLPGRTAQEPGGVQLLTPDGLVLGLKIDDGSLFDRLLVEQTLALHDGDVVVLFTDGVSEAMNAQDDCYGEARLSRVVEQGAHLPIEALRDAVRHDVEAFAGDAPQHDDMTMILVKVGDVAAAGGGAGTVAEVARA